jgi:hypothetical protein
MRYDGEVDADAVSRLFQGYFKAADGVFRHNEIMRRRQTHA